MSVFDMGPNGAYVWAGWIISALTLAAAAFLVWRERDKARRRRDRTRRNAMKRDETGRNAAP